MICPRCLSDKTERIHLVDSHWVVGGQRCLDCGKQGHWTTFLQDTKELKLQSDAKWEKFKEDTKG